MMTKLHGQAVLHAFLGQEFEMSTNASSITPCQIKGCNGDSRLRSIKLIDGVYKIIASVSIEIEEGNCTAHLRIP